MGLKRQVVKGDQVMIGDDITITISEAHSRVRLDIDAPADLMVSFQSGDGAKQVPKGQTMTPEEQQKLAAKKFFKGRKR